ncbi:MAG: hypothetical protein ACLVJO_04805 [[Clostridium] scindens]
MEQEDKLSLRDRSLVTVVALMVQGLWFLIQVSFDYSEKNGITKAELQRF